MRVAAALFVALVFAPAAASLAASLADAAGPTSSSNCHRTGSYYADRTGARPSETVKPRKLTELPPGTVYMAVYRHIGGCEAPLTMAHYRNPRGQ